MTTFNDITEFRILPINRLMLYALATDDRVNIYNAEQDSSYKLDPVTRTSMFGETRTLVWKFSCTFTPVQTNVDAMIKALQPFVNNRCTGYLELRALPSQLNGSLAYIPLSQGLSVTWSIESGDMRPRLSIIINAVLTSPEMPVTEPVI
jgi:hypothetical protein